MSIYKVTHNKNVTGFPQISTRNYLGWTLPRLEKFHKNSLDFALISMYFHLPSEKSNSKPIL